MRINMNYKIKIFIVSLFLTQMINFTGTNWFIASAYANPYLSLNKEEVKEKMMLNLVPLGAIAMCIKKFPLNKDVYKEIALDYNKRNKQKLKELALALEKTGGMSKKEYTIWGQSGYKAAEGFLKKEGFTQLTCNNVARFVDSGSMDL